MAFLSTEDLSALMRTCRYFLDACLIALCARSNELHFDLKMTRLPSFRRFLRINAGPSCRAHLVKDLCVYAGGALERQYLYEDHFIALRKEWSAALLDILRYCHNMRRLRMYKWFLHDIPFPFFPESPTLDCFEGRSAKASSTAISKPSSSPSNASFRSKGRSKD